MGIFLKTAAGADKLKPHGMKEVWARTAEGADKLWVNFILPAYTGQHAIFGDETQGRIECYSSGELTLAPAIYDLFLVGGGSGGGGSDGGGGGFTHVAAQRPMEGVYTAMVGGGGIGGNNTTATRNGSDTIFYLSETNTISASGGGKNVTYPYNGGSGGGFKGPYDDEDHYSVAGNGGSDGSKGYKGYSANGGGNGQLTTTRMFHETGAKLFSGGGASICDGLNSGGVAASGGAGGGGRGGKRNGYNNYSDGQTAGAINSGGGGGGAYKTGFCSGGSGIVIIRWGY